ncbi:HAD-IIB family hydrolase [Spiroplasma tabanidicola]|uniref:HAD superfamily hydrolase n=1 Tax=Spiroplasma tabanidicola TaxID=324079 RepID=A0A6I6CCY9_9MOLU|nr:HAD-IIB family hydrolase [Spiroplasma tabanidicola]QGS52002.1 HAD superfamily hydrolase [Spiroplasma tabanidicola]
MSKFKKVAASDLDGTIVKEGNILTNSNKQLIKEFMQKTNNAFTIVTGRNYFSALQHAIDLDVSLPIITTNGTSLIDPKTHQYIAQHHFTNQEGNEILDVLYENGFDFYLLNDIKIYALETIHFADKDHQEKHNFVNSLDDLTHFYKTRDELYHAIKENVKGSFTSLNVSCYSEEEYNSAMKTLSKFELATLKFDYKDLITIEIYKKGAGKDWGLKALAKYLEISEDNIYVFGDEFNDYPMFRNFKNTYAVGNAIPGIKELAKEVILPIDQDGVGKKLLELVEEFKK